MDFWYFLSIFWLDFFHFACLWQTKYSKTKTLVIKNTPTYHLTLFQNVYKPWVVKWTSHSILKKNAIFGFFASFFQLDINHIVLCMHTQLLALQKRLWLTCLDTKKGTVCFTMRCRSMQNGFAKNWQNVGIFEIFSSFVFFHNFTFWGTDFKYLLIALKTKCTAEQRMFYCLRA